MENRRYKCKVLLYGEYTVLFGSPAFAIPSGRFSGQWTVSAQTDPRLISFFRYLKKDPFLSTQLDAERMDTDVSSGLSFESSIPVGYGMGSSGALTAAVYDRYARDPVESVDDLREVLSAMEAFFHGKSSGIDPLVSYLDRPILKSKDGLRVLNDRQWPDTGNIYLLDSGMSRSTSRLVSQFKLRLQDDKVRSIVEDQWSPLVNEAIEAHLEGHGIRLLEIVKVIQGIVWETFPEFIPAPHKEFWKETLDLETTALKLCGAGGGGMTLGFGGTLTEMAPIRP